MNYRFSSNYSQTRNITQGVVDFWHAWIVFIRKEHRCNSCDNKVVDIAHCEWQRGWLDKITGFYPATNAFFMSNCSLQLHTPPTDTGVVDLGSKWARVTRKVTNPGSFSDHSWVHFGLSKCTEIWSEKLSELSHLEPIYSQRQFFWK